MDITPKTYTMTGTDAPWYQGWDITEEQREKYRNTSRLSQIAKKQASSNDSTEPSRPVNTPNFDPLTLMPRLAGNRLRALSLFSGGGGLDLGFEMAGFDHVASCEILSFAADTIRINRPHWTVMGGEDGDATTIDWREYRGKVDVIHGGPPCQPFSSAGRQKGRDDARDMFPTMVKAIIAIEPLAFVAENVPGLTARKFQTYLDQVFFRPLSKKYTIKMFKLAAASFGIPQVRNRVFFVGFKDADCSAKYEAPKPTHYWEHLKPVKTQTSQPVSQTLMFDENSDPSLARCMGVREALGLSDIGLDVLAPTLRSTLTGPRHTTSILSSSGAARIWDSVLIWPNGVASDPVKASTFPVSNGHFRLSVRDCATLQGFPSSWTFQGAVYKALGQVGNAVPPALAYQVAKSLAQPLTH